MKLSIETAWIINDYGVDEFCRLAKNAGFSAIDYNLENFCKPHLIANGEVPNGSIFEKSLDEVLAFFDKEVTAFKKAGLTFSQAHAPYPSHVSNNPKVLDYTIEIYKRCIEFCDKVGIPYLVIHGISHCFWKDNETLEEIDDLNFKLYSSLIPTLEKTSVVVCLENLFITDGWGKVFEGTCTLPDKAVSYIDKLNQMCQKECFGFCIDTGHLNITHTHPRVFVEKLGHRIKCLHINDNNGEKDFHRMPYSGNFDWRNFLRAMKKIGYKGDLSFETFAQTDKNYTPKEMIEPTVNLIGEIGAYFKSVLTGEVDYE